MTEIERLVARIHATPSLAVLAITGAGSQALAWLLAVPGASRTLIEATVPYAEASLVELLGGAPQEYVSAETALAMARAALRRAETLSEGSASRERAPLIGLGCTATIATDRTKRGDHRCAVATAGEGGVWSYSLTLAKGARDRAGEEAVVSRLALHALAQASGVDPGIDLGLALGLLDGERVEVVEVRE
ncbi:MAG: hypothetical protein V3R95_02520 [Dehalococcoidia bacterium]